MTKISTFIIVLSSVFLLAPPLMASPTIPVDLGDETIEMVQTGSSGDYRKESLAYWFDQNGIANMDGSAIDPVEDQLQYELFYTDIAREYEVEFLGIGHAGYHSPFGVFTYDGDPTEEYDASMMTFYDPLFVQNEVPENSTYSFEIGADTHFGFYLNSNGGGRLDANGKPVSGGNKFLSTMVASNPKPSSNKVNNKDTYVLGLDHALFFESNMGYTIAFEDIVGGGDADYEDLVVNFSPTDGTGFTDPTEPIPEPASLFLLGAAILGIRRFSQKKV